MMAPITSELLRRCELYEVGTTVTAACAVLGQAVDAGTIDLADLLAQVKACTTPAQLADLLQRLAVTTNGKPEQELAMPTGGA